MSALELALELDVSYLIPLLRPVIHIPVPMHTLQQLEKHFHGLIHHELGDTFDIAALNLPVLEILTEYKSCPTWFPVRIGNRRSVCAFIPSPHPHANLFHTFSRATK